MRDTNPDLRILLFEITGKCNALCDQCGSRCDIDGEELLTKEDILTVLSDIKQNIGTDVMINITGGEPLMRTDLFDIMTAVTQMGFEWGMVTNGFLINEKTVSAMKKAGLKTITVSLDGLKDTHDRLRHLPGCFDHILKGLKLLKKENFLDHIQVTFTANRENVYELPDVYNIVSEIGIDSLRLGFIDEIGRAQDNNNLILKKEEMEFLIWFANKVNRENKMPIVWGCPHFLGNKAADKNFRCFAGIYSASILYNGDIFVCPNVPRLEKFIQGNIKKDSFSRVWKEGFEYFRNKPIPSKCKDCKYIDKCDGDSLHSMNFEKDEPRFCYCDIFEKNQMSRYKEFLKNKYGKLCIEKVDSGEENVKGVIIEPRAYEDIRRIFHMGENHPVSMYEQQVGMVGFRLGKYYVVRYVFEVNGKYRYKDNALFTKDVLRTSDYETKIIKNNYYFSDDKRDYVGNSGLMFIGFAHSHPIQEELCYSVGDVFIHKKLYARNKGNYVGILVNPVNDTIGAYEGKNINQADLYLLSKSHDVISS